MTANYMILKEFTCHLSFVIFAFTPYILLRWCVFYDKTCLVCFFYATLPRGIYLLLQLPPHKKTHDYEKDFNVPSCALHGYAYGSAKQQRA